MSVRRVVAGVVVAGCLVLAVGCASSPSGGRDSASSAPASASAGAASSEADLGAAPSTTVTDLSAAQTGTETAPDTPDAPDVSRSVVSTAMVTVESDNVIEARQRTVAIVESAGGAIFDEQTELGDQGRTTLTLRVPPAQFQSVLTDLGQVGKLTTQNISTEDVTGQVVDLDARIASAEVSVNRLRGFLDQATSVTDIAALERELAARETNLETLRGQKRTLDARIDLATIVLTVTPPVAAPVPPPEEATSLPGFLEGLSAGWSALVSTLTVVATIGGWLLPFVPFAVALALGIRWYRRRTSMSVELPPPPQPAA